MSAKRDDPLEKLLTSFEPTVDESLADRIIGDIDRTFGRKRLDFDVYCTKKSRHRSTFYGVLVGLCTGMLAGVVLTMFSVGMLRTVPGSQIAKPQVAKPQIIVEPSPTDVPHDNKPRSYPVSVARADTLPFPMSDVDRLIEQASKRAALMNPPNASRRYYSPRTYTSANIDERIEQLVKNRKLVEYYLQ